MWWLRPDAGAAAHKITLLGSVESWSEAPAQTDISITTSDIAVVC